MRALADLVAPVRCAACRIEADGDLCAACARLVRPIVDPICARCGTPPAGHAAACTTCATLGGFRFARSVVAYQPPASKLTVALKRRGRRALASDVAHLLASRATAEGLGAADVVTFVPAGKASRKRGFDHAELLARGVAAELGIECRRLLDRAREGPRQADVPFSERRSNAEGRFSSRRACGVILLVDDVFTTGATAEACANALSDAGADAVDVLTWARTLRRRH